MNHDQRNNSQSCACVRRETGAQSESARAAPDGGRPRKSGVQASGRPAQGLRTGGAGGDRGGVQTRLKGAAAGLGGGRPQTEETSPRAGITAGGAIKQQGGS